VLGTGFAELGGTLRELRRLPQTLRFLVGYLLYAHRLFGVRGGGRADRAEREADTGWSALRRATPWLVAAAPRGPAADA
jgi:hypothetical protein